MKLSAIITHFFCLLTGWVLLSFAVSASSTPKTSGQQKSAKSLRQPSPSRSTTVPPRSLLVTLARVPLAPKTRESIKLQILNDWAEQDPVTLLEHLADRAWPSANFRAPFYSLAESNPNYLLAYARREGCPEALRALSLHGNPQVVLALFLTQPPGTIPAKYFDNVFAAGLDLDPEFHRHLEHLVDPEHLQTAFRVCADHVLALRRTDLYFSLIEEHLPSLDTRPLARDFGYLIAENELDVALLQNLPSSLQEPGVDAVLDSLMRGSVSYQRSSLSTLHQDGYLETREDAVLNVFRSGVGRTQLSESEAWRDWALSLPSSAANHFLREAGVRMWIISHPEAWPEIAELPSQSLRDVAYTAALYELDLQKHAAQVEWIIGQIDDDPLREVATKVVEERIAYLNEAEPDPFRGDTTGDPFDPFPADDSESERDPFGAD